MTLILGPLPCIDCGRPVVLDRRGADWRIVEIIRIGKRSGKARTLPHECDEFDARKWARAAA